MEKFDAETDAPAKNGEHVRMGMILEHNIIWFGFKLGIGFSSGVSAMIVAGSWAYELFSRAFSA